jgi:hypothetical protein
VKKYKVNLKGLNLFFNKDTLHYAMQQLHPDITRKEVIGHLKEAGFDEFLAPVMVNVLEYLGQIDFIENKSIVSFAEKEKIWAVWEIETDDVDMVVDGIAGQRIKGGG